MKTKEMDLSNYSRVDARHVCKVEVIRSDSYSVSITTGDKAIKSVKVTKKDGTLKIRRPISSLYGLLPGALNARITMPALSGMDLSGASKGTVCGFSSKEDFATDIEGASSLDIANMSTGDIKFKLAGASKVTGQIKAGDAKFNLNGASKVKLEGSAGNIAIDADGASQADLANFQVGNVDVKLKGASRSTVNMDGQLDADLSGTSKLYWLGKPVMVDIKTAGASKVSRK